MGLLNARMVSSKGVIGSHIVEVQLHQKDLREERMNVGGHFIYERHRALFEACEKACGDEAGAKLADLHTQSAHVMLSSLSRSMTSSRVSTVMPSNDNADNNSVSVNNSTNKETRSSRPADHRVHPE